MAGLKGRFWSGFLLSLAMLGACQGHPSAREDADAAGRWQSVFVLFVVAQQHPCPFHPLDRADILGPLPGHGCKSRRIGSGFLISQDGIALTNHHVVDRAVLLEAVFGDGTRYQARVVATDPETDVAVIRLEGPGSWEAMPIGALAQLHVGDTVYALGSPIGLSGTMTRGIVSHLDRVLDDKPLVSFIQTDAGLHPGNSGGPLVDAHGRVVGINTLVAHSEGLGFAVPIDLALAVATTLRADGRVDRGSLGIEYQPLDGDLAKSLGLEATSGLLITDVLEGGPGARAGLAPGDVIVTLNGAAISSDESYRGERAIASLRPGSAVPLEIQGTLGRRRAIVSVATRTVPARPRFASSSASPLGMSLSDSPGGLSGAEVLDVEPGGPAERGGLAPGDVIVELDRQPINRLEDLRNATTGTGTFLVRLRRGSRHLFAVIKKSEPGPGTTPDPSLR